MPGQPHPFLQLIYMCLEVIALRLHSKCVHNGLGLTSEGDETVKWVLVYLCDSASSL